MRFVPWLFLALLCGIAHAQTVAPSNFGLNLKYPSTTVPKVFAGVYRLWNATDAVGTDVSWAAIETSRGTYNWTQLDAQVAKAQAAGAKMVYTIGDVPGWANGNAGVYVPPTSFSDLYTFVTALVTRYAGDGITYSIWNEANLPTNWWGGTVAQMVTIAQNVYSIVHTIDPSASVATPSVTSSGGFAWMQSYLAAGGGTYADVMDIHCYPIRSPSAGSVPPTSTPEANAYIAQQYAAMYAYYGQSAKPTICDEGGWATSSISELTTAQEQAYASIWQILYASAGFASFGWYEYDDPSWGTLWDGSTGLNVPGQAYRVTQAWLAGATFATSVARVAGTNQIRNPTGTGMVAGTPGTPPTDWSVYNPDSTHGIVTQFVGTCASGAGVEWLVSGTATAGASGFVQLSFETGTHIAATANQQWTAGFYAQLMSGAVIPSDAQMVLEINENNSSGTYLDNILYFFFSPNSGTLTNDLQSFAAKTVNVSVAYIVPNYTVTYSVGDTLNVPMCIGTPTADTGSVWSGTITRSGGYQGQLVWDSAGGPTSYTASGTYTYQRDLFGNNQAVVGNGVVLNNLPVLLENTKWTGWSP